MSEMKTVSIEIAVPNDTRKRRPEPIGVWKKLSTPSKRRLGQNKLELRRKLHTLKLKDGESVQLHVKKI